jgi:hypothetical protein
MSCCYCGKRVSLVRKRVDADFCCDDHREKYHARTRRSIETLRQADEHVAVKRRLNEGIPERSHAAQKGPDLDSLRVKSVGEPAAFAPMYMGLPVSRPRLETYVPGAALAARSGGPRSLSTPAPRLESIRWSVTAVQQGPRPPRPFTISIRLPQGGVKKMQARQAACDRPRRPRTGPSVELGASARALVRRLSHRPAEKTIRALLRSARPPAPVKSPRPTAPITVTLRQAAMAIHLGNPHQAPRVSVRMPQPGMTGMQFAPPRAEMRPPSATYVAIVRRKLSIPSVAIDPGRMPPVAHAKGGQRSAPCPEGFRRRQYYSSEPLERFCGVGFQTIAGLRPEIRIVAAPNQAAYRNLAGVWAAPLQDPDTIQPEPRRPAPPFHEQVSKPAAIGWQTGCEVRSASAGRLKISALDSRFHLPTLHRWDAFPGGALVRHQGGLSGFWPAAWVIGTAGTQPLPAWDKAQNQNAKRTASHLGISVRQPVFSGPVFAAGSRQAGPAPEKTITPPAYAPAEARALIQGVLATRSALLPASAFRRGVLRRMPMLTGVCQAPVGRTAAARILHPAYPILVPAALPSGHLSATAVSGLHWQPPARQEGSAFDVAKEAPQMISRLALERFRRRGYEAMHSRHTAPHWPAGSVPGLLLLAAQAPCPHPAHQSEREPAMTMYRGGTAPAAAPFRRIPTLMDWGTVAPPMPSSSDGGRAPSIAAVALPLPFVLPVDSLGPIRDWGLAPPPEPEQPPEPVHEDFAAGLANWLCANADWRQDIAGVRTGSLALLRPSLNMCDYELEFLGKIENQSLGWVFRAANSANYHAVRIVLDSDSATAQLARFAVLAGEREEESRAPLPITVAQNASCRVKMSVQGSEFKLYINDKPAFAWEDSRLPEGGVGFFSEADDRARLYWVKVTPFYESLTDELDPPIANIRAEIHREIRMGV